MRILHASYLAFDVPGIRNQLLDESRVIKPAGVIWETRLYCSWPSQRLPAEISVNSNPRPASDLISSIFERFKFYKWLAAEAKRFDLILLRYDPASLPQFLFLLSSHRHKVYLVHHAKELDEIRLDRGLKKHLKLSIESFLGRHAIRLAAGTIGVTREIIDHEVLRSNLVAVRQGLLYPNGIDLEAIKVVSDLRSDIPELIFVASSFTPWQGLDKLISILKGSQREFVVHVIGQTDQAFTDDPRFRFYGPLSKEEILKISQRCWVGISSLALERQGLTEACALKVREYLASGLPVYGGYKEVLPDDFPYYRQGHLTESDLFDFASSCRNISREEVRASAQPHIAKNSLISRLIDQINVNKSTNKAIR